MSQVVSVSNLSRMAPSWLRTPAGWQKIWALSFRSGFAICDQGITSGSSLVLNALLARSMAPEQYGAFAVAFATLLICSGFHNVLLLEPLTVIGPSEYQSRIGEYFRAQLVVHAAVVSLPCILLLVVGLGIALVQHASPMSGALIGAAVALPFLLLYWLARRMLYVVQRPAASLIGSTFYFLCVVGGALLLLRNSSFTVFEVFLVITVGSLAASLLLFYQAGLFRVTGTMTRIPWKKVFSENWGYGHWLVASTVLFSVSTQVQTFLAASLLGLGAAGMFRAMQVPMMAMVQVITAISLLEMPRLAALASRGELQRLRRLGIGITAMLSGVALAYELVLIFSAKWFDQAVFGGKYSSSSWLIPIIGLAPVFIALGAGFSVSLRALQKPKFDFVMNCFAAPTGLVSSVLFIRLWGVAGAAASLVLSYAVSTIVTFYFFRKQVPASSLVVAPANLTSDVLTRVNQSVEIQ